MTRKAFDEYDLRVFEAHSLAEEGDGGATFDALSMRHAGPLPVQRVSGLNRRGLMFFDGHRWFLTPRGVRDADAYVAASGGKDRPDA